MLRGNIVAIAGHHGCGKADGNGTLLNPSPDASADSLFESDSLTRHKPTAHASNTAMLTHSTPQ